MATALYTISTSKRDIVKMVAAHCHECSGRRGKLFCKSRSCNLYPIRIMRTIQPDQQHMFRCCDKADFQRNIFRMALSRVGSFAFADLRESVTLQPLSPAWWGSVTNTGEWRRTFRATGMRTSTTKSRNGGAQMLWQRRGRS